jgi:hypothetical protein
MVATRGFFARSAPASAPILLVPGVREGSDTPLAAENADWIAEVNERRRLGERERDCVDCGQTFTFKSTLAVRCPSCRRQRKLEQRRALRVA